MIGEYKELRLNTGRIYMLCIFGTRCLITIVVFKQTNSGYIYSRGLDNGYIYAIYKMKGESTGVEKPQNHQFSLTGLYTGTSCSLIITVCFLAGTFVTSC